MRFMSKKQHLTHVSQWEMEKQMYARSNIIHPRGREGMSSSESIDVRRTAPDAISLDSLEPPPTLYGGTVTAQGEEISTKPHNEKALRRSEPTYKLETFKKNALIVFSPIEAPKHKYETHKDIESLTNTFKKINFEIKTYYKLTKNQIDTALKEFMARDFTEYGCIGVVVLLHGSSYGQMEAAEGTFVSDLLFIKELKSRNKHTLVTKPKFLIIQTCRNLKEEDLVPKFQGNQIGTDAKDDLLEPYHLSEEADLLILHSCYDGTASYLNRFRGSWLIQLLCKAVNLYASTHDFESIITKVKREVCKEKGGILTMNAYGMTYEVPVLTSTLTRKLYLKKFGDPPPLMDPALIPPLTFDEEFLPPMDSSMDDGGMANPSVPYSFIAFFVIYVIISLFSSKSLNIQINIS